MASLRFCGSESHPHVVRPVAYLHGEPWLARAFPDNPLIGAGFWAARFTAVKVPGMELCLLVFPLRLSSDYSYSSIPISTAVDLRAWASLAAILAIVAITGRTIG